MTTRAPNFFIIGAPKCGTTALATYLRDHPEVYFCDPKEPKFFCPDIVVSDQFAGWTNEDYLRTYFSAVEDHHRAVGEGTVLYLMSDVAVPRILELNPDAKFIVMLRNPTDLAYSFFYEQIKQAYEDIYDFEEAWRAQEDRRAGRRLPHWIPAGGGRDLLYGDACKLGSQLEKLYAQVPRERVHLIFYEDFSSDTKGAYSHVLEFLGLSDMQPQALQRENVGVVPSSKAVYRLETFLKRLSSPGFVRLKSKVRSALGIESFGLVRAISKFNRRKQAKRPRLSAEMRAELDRYFAEEVNLLERLTGRDLSAWKA